MGDIPRMAIVPLYGHDTLRERLLQHARQGRLPQSLLFHGPAGVGKQRLALWLAQVLLCGEEQKPCGVCQQCHFVLALTHPDLVWAFPRPRPREQDSKVDDVAKDLADARLERASRHGLYAPPPTAEGLYVATVRYLVRQASLRPALATRKVFIVGEADRMVPQEGSEFAANAFLKLLEEPPDDTWVIVTTSAPGALLPTIRSRVVSVRVPRVDDAAMGAFVADPVVRAALDELQLPANADERVRLAQGAPGALLATSVKQDALDDAHRLLEAALSGDRAQRLRMAFVQGQRGARGGFSDVLDALTLALHDRLRADAQEGSDRPARAAGRAIDFVEEAKRLAEANVNPQLIAARLLDDLAATLT